MRDEKGIPNSKFEMRKLETGGGNFGCLNLDFQL